MKRSWEVERWEARRATRAFGWLLVVMGVNTTAIVALVIVWARRAG